MRVTERLCEEIGVDGQC